MRRTHSEALTYLHAIFSCPRYEGVFFSDSITLKEAGGGLLSLSALQCWCLLRLAFEKVWGNTTSTFTQVSIFKFLQALFQGIHLSFGVLIKPAVWRFRWKLCGSPLKRQFSPRNYFQAYNFLLRHPEHLLNCRFKGNGFKNLGLDLLQVSVVVSDFHLQAQVGQVSTFYPTQLMPFGLWQTHWSCWRASSRPWMPLHLLCDPVPPALYQLRWGCPEMIDPRQGFSWGWAPPWRRIVCWWWSGSTSRRGGRKWRRSWSQPLDLVSL